MRLSINGWPPLASHLACILIGGAISHINEKPKIAKHLPLPEKQIQMALSKETLEANEFLKDGFVLIGKRVNQEVCLLKTAKISIKVLSSQVLIIGSFRQFESLKNAVKLAQEGSLVLIDPLKEKEHNQCLESPRIRYDKT